MLQLGGVITGASLRLHPRVSWCATAQQLLFVSSVAPDSKPDSNVIKDKTLVKSTTNKDQMARKYIGQRRAGIASVFKSIMKTKDRADYKSDPEVEKFLVVNEKLRMAKNVTEVLDIVDSENFSEDNAVLAVTILYKFVTDGINTKADFESDIRFSKLQEMLNRNFKSGNRAQSRMSIYPDQELSQLGVLQTQRIVERVKTMSVVELLRVLHMLSATKKRSIPILQAVTAKLATSTSKFTIKHIADILYHLSVLNYPDDGLIIRCSNDIVKLASECQGSAVIGSILKSLGMLKYRNEDLLNVLCDWVAKKPENLRPQEICSLLMTLATLGYCPDNFAHLYKNIIEPLKENDMIESSQWLDLVWSLTILNKATLEHYQSVLNESFQHRIFDMSAVNTSKEQKMLNVHAAAELALDYKGPLLPKDSLIFNVSITRSQNKYKLVNSAIGALKVLLPTASVYLNTNINTKMGFLLDAEFCVDENCNRVPVDMRDNSTSKNIFRIGVMTSDYHDHSRGSVRLLGISQFYIKLLELRGYNVLHLPYTEFRIDDKLIDRVKYINGKIKLIVENGLVSRSPKV